MRKSWDKTLLALSPSDLVRYAAIAFALLVLPVWCFRACRAAQTPMTRITPDIPATPSIELERPSIPIAVYDDAAGYVVDMDLEDYLVGVVAAEMPASYESEALKAQAVAARTYAVKKMKRFSGSGCDRGGDVCTDSNHCQAYRSPEKRRQTWGRDAETNEARIQAAVTATAGQIVTYDDQPIEAFFHSTSGGMTEDSANAFSEPLPYLKSVPSDETDAPRYQNALELSRAEFANAVNKAYGKAKLKAKSLEKSVAVLSRYPSGRAERIRLGKTEISGKQLRALFALDSSNVTFEFTKNAVILHTKGYGHGVGMSQTGANDMAKTGSRYDEILSYYYQNTKLALLPTG